ncbi:MAG: SNF2-related protein [Puniceicoccaceae bacterium]
MNERISRIQRLPEARQWMELSPSAFYYLQNTIHVVIGVQKLADGSVSSLSLAPGCLIAEVEGHRALLRLEEDGNVSPGCDCSDFTIDGQCEHVGAALAALFVVFQNKTFGYPAPPDHVRELLERSLLGEETPAGPKEDRTTGPDRRPRRPPSRARQPAQADRGSEPDRFLLKPSDGIPPFLLETGDSGDAGWSRHGSLDYSAIFGPGIPLYQPETDIPELLEGAADDGIPVHVETSRGEMPVRSPAIGAEMVRCDLVLRGDGVEEHPVPVGGGDAEIFRTTGFGYRFDTGTLFRAARNPVSDYLEAIYDRSVGGGFGPFDDLDGGGGDGADSGPPALVERNRASLCVPFQPKWAGKDLRLRVGDDPVDPPDPVRPRLAFRIEEIEDGIFAGRWFFEEGGLSVDASLFGMEVSDALRKSASFGPWRMTRSGRRTKALSEAILSWIDAGTARARKAVFRECRADELFASGEHQRELAEVEGNLGKLASTYGDPHHVLVASPDGTWRHWMISVGGFLKAAFILADPETREDFESCGQGYYFPAQMLELVLARAGRMGMETGAALYLRSKPVRTARATVRMKVTAGTKNDMFHLDPSVMADSFEIPPEEWSRMLKGEGAMRDGGDHWISVVPENPDALSKLTELARRRAESRRRNAKADLWDEPVPRLEILDLLDMRQSGVLVELPEPLGGILESLRSLETLPEAGPPPALREVLRPYQKTGFSWIRFLYEHRFGACLADDMGLGKTIQAIAFLESLRRGPGEVLPAESGAVLIVVPPSLVFNWVAELARFGAGLRVAEYGGRGRDTAVFSEADVVIATYDIMRLDIEKLAKLEFPVVVFDEAHALKNPSATRSRAAARLRRRFTLCLTGTPVENNPLEYYSVMTTALPGLWSGLAEFRDAFKASPETVLRRAAPFILRRTKEKILTELPPKTETDHYLDLAADQREIYHRTVAEVREEVGAAFAEKAPARAGIVALAALTRLRQVCVSPVLLGAPAKGVPPKISRLMEMLEELASEGHSALVFSQFLGGLDLAEEALRSRKGAVFRLDGKTPASERKKRIAAFQGREEPSVFLISLKAGGVGLNLTRANYVFHLDPWWNPAVENQASDRAHRIGQANKVFVERLLMRGTIEERMGELKLEKKKLFDQLVENPGSAREGAGVLSRKDFEFLLG